MVRASFQNQLLDAVLSSVFVTDREKKKRYVKCIVRGQKHSLLCLVSPRFFSPYKRKAAKNVCQGRDSRLLGAGRRGFHGDAAEDVGVPRARDELANGSEDGHAHRSP